MAHRFSAHDYEAFAASFGFEETPDQQAAIHAVIQDLISPKPMDRLVCGDVGFGKTEVALRAAFVAVHGGKQVAILAPTTLLAEQHYQTLVDRFGKWPVKVAEMSRFRSTKEIASAMSGIEDGTIDIVVGTHKLLSQTVKFKRLGLLIIDEEHRFGVRHKEAMKALRAEVDVLTLTATPIPRTLGMALEGLRDLSVIATAPQRRLAIKTFVRTRRQCRDPRGRAARAEARRAGVLPAQRGRDDPEPKGQARRTGARSAHRGGARPAARTRAGACDARLHRAAPQPAAVLDHHRDRHRRAQRQHHRHEPRRQVRPGAAAPAARARRPQPPPGLCLPAGARPAGPEQAGAAAAGRDPVDGRTGQRLLSGDARPGDPRRRRGAGRKPERQHDGGRLPALQRHAGRSRQRAEGRARAGPAEPLRRHDRDQPARARRCCPTAIAATCTRG